MSDDAQKTSELNQKDRLALLIRQLETQKKAAILLLEGSGIHGLQYSIRKMTEALDPRHFRLYHMPEDGGLIAGLPFLYEYWQNLPPMGDLAIFDRSYYYKLGLGLLDGSIKPKHRDRYLRQIADFERTLQDNDYLIYKIYLSTSEGRLTREYSSRRKKKKDFPRFLRDRYKTRLKRFKKLGKALHTLIDDAKDRSLWVSPWAQLTFERRSEARDFVFQTLIDWLERDLGIDSIAAVHDFDQAMERLRKARFASASKAKPGMPADGIQLDSTPADTVQQVQTQVGEQAD